KGFFEYKKNADPLPCQEAEQLRLAHGRHWSQHDLQSRMTLLMVNEAARCLAETTVATAADVDFGMVMGTGFAPFRGGPLRYADALGTRTVVAELQRIADAGSPHHAPCALLCEMNGRNFYADLTPQIHAI